MVFRTTLTAGFGDADPAGIVFYPQAIAMAHRLVEEFTRQTGPGWAGWFAHPAWAVPVRRVEAEFQSPLLPGAAFDATLQVKRLGATSVTLLVEFHAAFSQPAVLVTSVHVFVDRATGRPMAVPPEWRAALEG